MISKALHVAAEEDNAVILKLLLDNGADPTALTANGDSAKKLCNARKEYQVYSHYQ